MQPYAVPISNIHQSWVASIVFVMNILMAMENIFWQIFKQRFLQLFFQIKLSMDLLVSYTFVKAK
jgi:hypothetical protein